LKSTHLFFISFLLLSSFGTNAQKIEDKINRLVANMTLNEKIGQMTQVERKELDHISDLATYNIGSLLSGGGSAPTPNSLNAWIDMYNEYQTISMQSSSGIPMIYGIDAVHGHSNVKGAVIVPHNIGLGATWNTDLVKEVLKVVAKEVAATGIDWTFAPCVAVPQNERWGRTYEGFGETSEINQIMGIASVVGLQGNDLALDNTILACAKHFIGDGGTTDGIDQGDTEINEEVLRSLHMPAYIDAIEQGVGTIMATYNSWNGQKVHGYKYLLTDVLKTELGFEGFIISDWKGVDQVREDYKEAIKLSINAGVDMIMVPDRYKTFINHTKELVNEGQISMSRIDDAVKRILKQKILLGLFEQPYATNSSAEIDAFGSAEHRDIARQAVRESLVVLDAKNNVLPLKQDGQTIGLAGVLADDLGAQCGGWTIAWQGGNGDITEGTSILEGFQKLAGTSKIHFSKTADFEQDIDVAIVVIGEKTPYSEGGGDRSSLNIENQDIALLKKLKSKNIPTIAILISGRPIILGEALQHSDAMIAAWYPGTEGDGIAEVLFGLFDPKGKLTHSWPNHMHQIPINLGDANYQPLYPFKHGLAHFPNSKNKAHLNVYASTINNDGNILSVFFNDDIKKNKSTLNSYKLYVNGVLADTSIESQSIHPDDMSLLEIELATKIEEGDEIYLSIEDNVMFSENSKLTDAKNIFVFNGVKNLNDLSLRVEAESYYEIDGAQTEQCSDEGGGLNLGHIEFGDKMKYEFNVSKSGYYQLSSRISGFSAGSLDFDFGNLLINMPFEGTNGWQSWQTFYKDIFLEVGLNKMIVTAKSSHFNINYFDLIFVKDAHEIPGKIEAEKYRSSKGVQTEFCEDDNTENISHIDFEDTVSYPVKVNQSGYYKISTRYASTNDGYFKLSFGDNLHYFPFDNTGGWENWKTSTIEVFLEVGVYNMEFTAATNFLNLNYFELEFAGTFETNYVSILNDIQLNPVPSKNHIALKLPTTLDSNESIRLFDSKGTLINLSKISVGKSSNEYYLDLNLQDGEYFIFCEMENNTYIKSFVIE
jgi:beta-glucosidase